MAPFAAQRDATRARRDAMRRRAIGMFALCACATLAALRGARAAQEGTMKTRDGANTAVVTRERYVLDGALDEGALRAHGVDTRTIRVTLNTEAHGKIGAKVRGDGTFAVRDAPAGRHVLDVHAVGLNFPPVAVRIVGADDGEGGKVGDVEAHLAEDRTVTVPTKPLRLTPASTLEYYDPASSVSLGSLLRNPMALMVIMSVFLAVVAPKILEGIDPEELKRMQAELAGAARGEAPRVDAAD